MPIFWNFWRFFSKNKWFGGPNPQNFRLRRSQIPYKILIESTKIPKFSRLRRAYCDAGEIFGGFRAVLRTIFILQNDRRRRNFRGFRTVLRAILPYKMSAAGDFFFSFRALLRGFYLTKWAPQAKILRFQSATKGILPYKMNAAGGNFAVSERY